MRTETAVKGLSVKKEGKIKRRKKEVKRELLALQLSATS